MKLAMHQNSCKELSLVEFIKKYRKYEGIELNFNRIKKAIHDGMKLKDILELLEIHDSKVSSIFHLKDFTLISERKFKTKILVKFKQMMEFCYKLDSEIVIVRPSTLDFPFPEWKIQNKTRKRLEIISKLANDNDINIGFEFLNIPDCSISTLSGAMEVIEPLSLDNLGYVLDPTVDFSKLNNITDLIFLTRLRISIINSLNKHRDFKNPKSVLQEKIDPKILDFAQNVMKLGYRQYFSILLVEKDNSKHMKDNPF